MNRSNKCGLFASPMQTSMLLPSLLGHESQPYVQQFRWTFLESVDQDLLERAWKRVLKRHDTFYHRFEFGKGDRLRIRKSGKLQVEFKFLDWSHLPRTKRHHQLTSFLTQDLSRGFDPLKGNLSRIQLIRIHSRHSELVWTTHHALFDGRARLKLIQEFIEVYKALKAGKSIRLKQCPSYEEYLKWAEKQSWKSSITFWKKQLEDLKESTALNFGMGFQGGKPSGNQQSLKSRYLSSKLSTRLSNWSKKSETSLNILGQAAWGMFLHLSTGQDTVMFGAPRACRKSNIPSAESIVGLFVNTVPVIVKVDSGETVEEYTQRIKENWIQLRYHENTPLSVIQRACNVPSNKPLFESLIGYEKYQINQLAGNNGRSNYRFSLTGHTDIPFSIQLKGGDRIQLEVAYDNGRFSGNSVGQVQKSFIFLLEQLTTPRKRVSEIELLDKQDRTRIRKLGTGPRPKIPTTTVHRAFERRASEYPKATALRFNGQSTSYRSLNQQSNRLARYLKAKGVTPGDCIGILLERSEKPFIAQLAILKAGAFFLPLDPEYPEDRLKGMIENAAPKYILTETDLRAKVTAKNVTAIDLQSLQKRLQTFSARNLAADVDSDAPAYIMYTSGSTGEPKGVVVPHRAILRLVCKPNYVKLSTKTRCLQMATVSFDASTFEIWAPLLNGGCCVIYPERIPAIHTLGAILKKENVNTLWLTASLFNFIVDNASEILVGVKQLLAGGEALSPSHVRKAQRELPNTRLINGYGPTENTTFSCCYPIPKRQSAKLPVPIGPPISRSTCYVLNKQMKLLPPGCSGELYVGGEGVALGYLNNQELTQSKFVSDPFSKKPLARLYKTGDRVYQKPDGNIEFLDRNDDQVKIRGFRIEPMEVQNRLQRIRGIQACAVLVRKNHRGENELVAFSVLDKGCQLGERNLRMKLEAQLPDYMIPSGLYFLPELPLSSNGKVDRKALLNNTPSQEPKIQTSEKKLNKDEKALWEIWKDTLGTEPMHAEADFFDAGGHSLLATNFIHRAQTYFNLYISINDFYQHASIRKLAQLIEKIRVASKLKQESPLVIKPAKTNPLEPLSRTFQTTYHSDVVRPESTPTNQIVRAIELGGNLKPKRFLEALEAAINNHERYRTFTVEKDGEYFEKVIPHISLKVKRNNFSKLSNKVVSQKLRRIYQRMCQEWVSVRDGPMFRVSFSKLPDKRYFFCLAVNHSICDGNSLGMLFRETSQAYNNLIRTGSASLKKPKFGFKEYEKSLQVWLDGGNEKRIQTFWEKKLHNLEPIDYPFLKKKLPDGIKWNEFDHYRIDPFWTKKIRDFTEKNHISVYLFFLSLVKWMNARYTGQLDSYVASSANTRSGEDQDHIGGDFANVLLLRNELRLGATFVEQVKLDQETLYEAMDNCHIGMTTIAKPFRKNGLNIHKAGGQSRVSYAPNVESDLSLNGVSTKAWLRKRVAALMRFGFVIREHGEELLVAFQHAPEIFIKHGLERLKVNLQNLVKQVLENPDVQLSELPDLTRPAAYKKPPTKAEKRATILKPIRYIRNEGPQPVSSAQPNQKDKQTKTLNLLTSIWKEILQLEYVDSKASFQAAGGNSLRTIDFIYRIQRAFDVVIPHDFYNGQFTLEQLTEWIEANRGKLSPNASVPPLKVLPIKPKKVRKIGYKWKTHFATEIANPNLKQSLMVCRGLLLEGDLNIDHLRKSLEFVVHQNDCLRTHLIKKGKQCSEHIADHVEFELSFKDLSHLSENQALKQANDIYQNDCSTQLSLFDSPPFKFQLIKIKKNTHLLSLLFHHGIVDGTSLKILFKELSRAYNLLKNGKALKQHRNRYQYNQYALNLERWFDEGNLKRIHTFFQNQKKGLKPIPYPFLKKNHTKSPSFNQYDRYEFPTDWSGKLSSFLEQNGLSPYLFFSTLMKWVVARYTHDLDSYNTSPVDLREGKEQQRIAGLMSSLLLIRTPLDLDQPFLESARNQKEALLTARLYKYDSIRSLEPPDKRQAPNTEQVFGQLQVSEVSGAFKGPQLDGISSSFLPRKKQIATIRLGILITHLDGHFQLTFQYAPELFRKHGIERFKFHFQQFLSLVLDNPNLRLGELPDLSGIRNASRALTYQESRQRFLKKQSELPTPANIESRTAVTNNREVAMVRKLWKQVLGEYPKDQDQSFFSAGGHSLLAVEFLYRLQQAFDCPLSFELFQENPSVKNILRFIHQAPKQSVPSKNLNSVQVKSVRKRRLNELSRKWRTVYLAEIQDSSSHAPRTICRGIYFDGPLRKTYFKQALQSVVDLHDRLKTHVTYIDGEYFEQVHQHIRVELGFIDYSKKKRKTAERLALQVFEKENVRLIDMKDLPLFRFQLVKLTSSRHLFILNFHHGISDGISIDLFNRQLAQAYNDLCNKRKISLRRPKFQFNDIEQSREFWLADKNEAVSTQYWEKKLKPLKSIEYPFQKAHFPREVPYNVFDHYRIDEEMAERIDAFTKAHDISLFVFLSALTRILVARYTGDLYIPITTAVDSRPDPEHQSTMGDFAGIVILTSKLTANRTFLDQIRKEQFEIIQSLKHRHVPVYTLASQVSNPENRIHSPFDQLAITSIDTNEDSLKFHQLSSKLISREKCSARTRMGLIFKTAKQGLGITFQYAPNIFRASGVERFKHNFQQFVKLVLDTPDIQLQQLPDISCPKESVKKLTKSEKKQHFLNPL